jgi:hypothetical protein
LAVLSEHIIHIVVADRGATTDDVRIDGTDALLGSASHCHVRLSPDKVGREQLRFEVRLGELFAEVRSLEPEVTLDKQPFARGRLSESSVLVFGQLEVRAKLERGPGAHAARRGGAPRPTVLLTGALLLVALILIAVPRSERARFVAPAAPILFADEPEPCPEREPNTARAAAQELARMAEAKRDRAPFVPDAGLAAVHAYRAAGSCYELSGEPMLADRARQRARHLKAQVERDYHLHQVRVYLAQRAHDAALLSREARVLASYVKGRSDRYVDWLDQLQRELEATASTEGEP